MHRIIAIEASTGLASVALLAGGQVTERQFGAGPRQSECALVGIDELLRDAGIVPRMLDAVAVAIGPGAFTGIRLAIGIAQGLAAAIDRPVVPVSSLAALAANRSTDVASRSVLALLDARMGEVYAGWFDISAHPPVPIAPETLCAASALTRPPSVADFAVLGGGLREHADAIVAATGTPTARFPDIGPNAAAVARIAAALLPAGGVPATAVEPVYLRNKVALTTVEREAARG